MIRFFIVACAWIFFVVALVYTSLALFSVYYIVGIYYTQMLLGSSVSLWPLGVFEEYGYPFWILIVQMIVPGILFAGWERLRTLAKNF